METLNVNSSKKLELKILKGFGTAIAVPVLSVFSFGLVVSSSILLGGGFLRTFGVDVLNMNVMPGVEIPTISSIPVSIAVAAVFTLLAYGSWRLIKGILKAQ